MKKVSVVLALAVALAGACTKSDDKASVDSALSIGATTTPLDSITAAERAQGTALAPAPTTVVTTPAAPKTKVIYRDRPVSSGSSGSSGGGSTVSSNTGSSSRGTTTVKHTQRDAAIGAAAGAVIGATTSKNKVGGAVIGGVVGGVLGGVIGNNVDKTKKKN